MLFLMLAVACGHRQSDNVLTGVLPAGGLMLGSAAPSVYKNVQAAYRHKTISSYISKKLW